jgi:alanine racemase/UDP-N-acetylmuramoyl-tripeptide--D-alanyl-D-alanine ligase
VISAPPYEAELVVRYHLTPSVSTFEEIDELSLASQKMGQVTPVHLHICTGMKRFGCEIPQVPDLCHKIYQTPYLCLEGAMTHFVAAETDAFDSLTYNQILTFKTGIDSMPYTPKWIHAANSGGAVRFPIPFCNLVRIGLGFLGYGVCLEGSKPALQLTSKLVSFSMCSQGATVGYNCAYTFKKEKGRIGIIPIGYHDGLRRILSNAGYVLIREKKAPMIGMICMDFMMIDLTDIPEASLGDEVILFGPGLSPEILAGWAQTDVRELLAGIAPRVQRLWNFIPICTKEEHESTDTERLPISFFSFEKGSIIR